MPRKVRVTLLALGLGLLAACPAQAAKLTLGSDLAAGATMIESHGQDSAFWPVSIKGQNPAMPEDGQIISVTMKGTVYREKGAANPANLIHFQSLIPEGGDGSMRVWLTSQDFYLPVDEPNAVTTFKPENLCVKQGGYVAFNDIGGFMYGGSLSAPLDKDHYHDGADFAVFGAVRGSVTARFSGDNATKNGAFMTTTGANNAGPGGTITQGQELLMQYVVATGDDRSEPCGGPRRHPDGTLVDVGPPPSYLKVASAGGKPQRPYVTKDRRFAVGVYCGGIVTCTGTAVMLIGDRQLTATPFSIPASQSARLPMRLSARDFRALDRSKARRLRVRYVMSTPFGEFRSPVTLTR